MKQISVPAGRDYPLRLERALILTSLLVLALIAWAVIVWQADSTGMNMGSTQSAGGGASTGASMAADGSRTSEMASSAGAMSTAEGVSASGGETAMAAATDTGMGLTMDMSALLFLGVWVAMMVAIMFPTAAPMILAYAKVQAARQERGQVFVPTWFFVLAYIALWSATGFIAYGAAAGGDELASRIDWLASNGGRIGGVLLIVAGLYQLSPLKEKCLSTCRTPMSFILGSWRDGRLGAVAMGLQHGVYCFGCCWFLFAILFPLGMMNVAAMAVIALVIFAEKSLAIGHNVARATAAGLIAYGAAVALAFPEALPTSLTI